MDILFILRYFLKIYLSNYGINLNNNLYYKIKKRNKFSYKIKIFMLI